MARTAAGDWIPLAPVVGGTIITSTWANSMMTSFGADITQSLDRSGRGGMLVPFRIADGTEGEPGYSWTAEISTGLYRDLGGFDMRVSVGGVDNFRWNANGAQMWSVADQVWYQVLSAGGTSGAQTTVNVGTAVGQTLRWNTDTPGEEFWENTSVLLITDTDSVSIGNTTIADFADFQVRGSVDAAKPTMLVNSRVTTELYAQGIVFATNNTIQGAISQTVGAGLRTWVGADEASLVEQLRTTLAGDTVFGINALNNISSFISLSTVKTQAVDVGFPNNCGIESLSIGSGKRTHHLFTDTITGVIGSFYTQDGKLNIDGETVVALGLAGSPRVTLDVVGLGISNTSPGCILDVNGSTGAYIGSAGTGIRTFTNTSTQTGGVGMECNAGGTGSRMQITFSNPNGNVGQIRTSGSATIYDVGPSDYRLKENVIPMTPALAKVMSLNLVNYNFIKDPAVKYDGMLAHELGEAFPEYVLGEKDGVDSEGDPQYQSFDKMGLVVPLLKAIQELTARLEVLENG